MRGAIPPLPHYIFMVWCLVKHRDSFTFTLNIQGYQSEEHISAVLLQVWQQLSLFMVDSHVILQRLLEWNGKAVMNSE
jgi:hypothetical protein